MKDFKAIRKTCEASSNISKKVIDEFLLYYAAGMYKLDHPMTEAFSAYRHVTNEFEKEWVNRLKAQYLAHKIFKSDGLIRKMLPHTDLRKLSRTEMDFLEQHSTQPWRFCFSIIIDNPETDFFTMEDILTDEQFLLFSPGTSDIQKSQGTSIWFNLIGFNGACWQSFGPIAAYKSFEPDDIFFFATELDRRIQTEQDLVNNIDRNPLPYMMLLTGANIPLTFGKQDQMVQVCSEHTVGQVDTIAFTKSFTSDFSKGVYRFTLKRWGGPPHFAHAYYDQKKNILVLNASTDRGFLALVDAINPFGYQFSREPEIRVNMSMLITSSKILKKEIKLNEYEHLFHADTPPKEKEKLDHLNSFIQLIIPDLNSGRTLDVEKYAAQAGLDIETARDLTKTLLKKFGDMDQQKG